MGSWRQSFFVYGNPQPYRPEYIRNNLGLFRELLQRHIEESTFDESQLCPAPTLSAFLRKWPWSSLLWIQGLCSVPSGRCWQCAIQAMEHAFLLVQGPPGTGKSYVGVRMARLVYDLRNAVMAQKDTERETALNSTLQPYTEEQVPGLCAFLSIDCMASYIDTILDFRYILHQT